MNAFPDCNGDLGGDGIDIDEDGVKDANERYQSPNISYKVCDIFNLKGEFKENEFDDTLNNLLIKSSYKINNYKGNKHIRLSVRCKI